VDDDLLPMMTRLMALTFIAMPDVKPDLLVELSHWPDVEVARAALSHELCDVSSQRVARVSRLAPHKLVPPGTSHDEAALVEALAQRGFDGTCAQLWETVTALLAHPS
jgi:hypothetical protein